MTTTTGESVPFILVVGRHPNIESADGACTTLRHFGSAVRTCEVWDDFADVVDEAPENSVVRAMVFEAGERPDLAAAALGRARQVSGLARTTTMVTLPPDRITWFDPSSGFDDFIVAPFMPAELDVRIRTLEWRHNQRATEERQRVGTIVVDRSSREVRVGERRVTLTAREFALLAFLVANLGRMFSRETLLERVWGSHCSVGQPLHRWREDRGRLCAPAS
jgi:hypothetical protein